MNRSKVRFVSVFIPAVCLCFAAACNNGSPNGTAAQTELEGTWVGHILGQHDTATYRMILSGSAFVESRNTPQGFSDQYSGVFTLNTAADPKQMDATINQCALSQSYVGKTSLCIYKLSNDTLTYAGSEPGAPVRPASFDTTGASGSVVFRLVRR